MSGSKVTRRSFIRDTAKLGVGVAAAGMVAGAASARASAAPITVDQFDKEADVVVAGAGIGGLSAALKAAQDGAKVILFEAAPEVGGTATLAGASIDIPGFPDSLDKMQRSMPAVDESMGEAYIAAHKEWIASLIQLGTPLNIVENVSISLGGSYKKNLASLEHVANKFKEAGGELLFGLMAERLITDSAGNVVGIRALGKEGKVDFKAKAVVIATGSFPNNPRLVRELFGGYTDRAQLRAVPYNTGAGIEMALEVGALMSKGLGDYYSRPLPVDSNFKPIIPFTPEAFEAMDRETIRSLMFSVQGFETPAIILNTDGKRFRDESIPGQYIELNMAYAQQYLGRVFFITDQAGVDAVRGNAASAIPNGAQSIELITSHGGRVIKADTLDALVEALGAEFGVNKPNLLATINAYNTAVNVEAKSALNLDIPRGLNAFKIEKAPFYAVPATGGLGQSYGGLAITTKAEVISRTLQPIPALYAVPAAAGGVQILPGYIRNLGSNGAFGYIAGRSAAAFAKSKS